MAIPKDARITLDPEEIPKHWYNLAADLPEPIKPPLNPVTKEPAKPEDFAPIFCKPIIEQEGSTQRYIDIPEEVRDNLIYLSRPSPIQRAYHLERYLKTPAKIYFKREDMSPLGSHKGNTALAQAYYNAESGIHTLTTETGAGQWGTALSMVSNMFDIDTTVFMVRGSYEQKPFRKTLMHLYGAKVYASPSEFTEFGKKINKEHPGTTGSLGIAISEACELAVKDDHTCYALGSVLGGSNFAGFTFPMMREKIRGKSDTEIIAVEPKAAPSLTEGEFRYDYGDTAGMTPLIMMYTLGSEFVPKGIHAGGLRYHGMSPLVSAAYNHGYCSAVAYDQPDTFEAGAIFARTEGIVPAPESCHAVRAAIDKALECKKTGEEKTIVFCLSGHGLLDLYGYEQYIEGTLPSSSMDD